MKTKSASNVAERKPVSSKAAAKQQGAIGHAFAAVLLGIAVAAGKAELQKQISMKDRLRELMKFPGNADHIAFRGDLDNALDGVKKEAEAAKLTLNAYCDANPIAYSLRATVSLWVKMSRAVEHGMTESKVDFDKPWADISKLATEMLDSVASGSGKNGGTQQGGPRSKKGRSPKPILDKVKDFANKTLLDEKTKVPVPNRNLAAVVGVLLQSATISECNEVLAEVTRLRDLKVKVEAEMKAKAQKESDDAPAVEGVTKPKRGKRAPAAATN